MEQFLEFQIFVRWSLKSKYELILTKIRICNDPLNRFKTRCGKQTPAKTAATELEVF